MGKSLIWDGEKAVEEINPDEDVFVWDGTKAVKKKGGGKVGSIAYPELELETPSTSRTSNEIIGLANEFKRISGRVSEIEKPIYTPGGGVLLPKGTSRDKGKLTEIETEIKNSGYDPKEILQEFGDFPIPSQELDIKGLLKEKKENPLSYARHKSAYKWQVPLFNNIRSKDPDAESTIQLILSGQAGGGYAGKRQQTKTAIEAVRKYVDDIDEQEKIIKQISNDKAFSYGVDDEEKMQAISEDERYLGGNGLNKYQIQALHFLEDTDPAKAGVYNRITSVGSEGQSDDFKRGFEYKARELESLGMDLERRALEESMTELKNKQKKEGLSEQDIATYDKLYSQYDTMQKDVEIQSQRFPNIAAMDADMLAQEALGQRNGPWKRGVLGVGENVGDLVNFFGDIVQSPFRNSEDRVIDDLEDLGDKKFTASAQRYRTAANQIEQPDYVPDFKKPLADQITDVKEGTLDERLSKVRNLILNNFDKVGQKKNPEAGKFNFTSGAIFNTISDVGSEIASSISLAATTGGLGNISKARSMATMFASTYATAYTDYYNEAIEKNISNPTTYAITHTTKEALSELINNDLAVVKRLVNPKSTLANIAKNITREQWDDIAKTGTGRFAKAFGVANKTIQGAAKNTFGELKEELAAQVGGNVVDMEMFNQDVDLADGIKSTIVNTVVGTLPLGLLGVVGNIKSMNRNQKYALYEAAQNKDKYLAQLETDVQSGVITQDKADKIKIVIEGASKKLNELADGNKINQDKTDNEKVDILAKEVQTENAKAILQEAVAKGKVKGVYAEQAATDPDGVLKDISRQAQNLNPKFEPLNDKREDDSRQAAEETFGNKLVEAAISAYPAKEIPTVASAVIEINGKIYEGNNHAEAILKAKAEGQDISQVDRKAQGKFKLSDGTIIDRAEAKQRFGQDRSELLIKQDEAADQANKDYAKESTPSGIKESKEVVDIPDGVQTKDTTQNEKGKRIVEPSKPVSEMNSDELFDYAKDVKAALKKQDAEFEGKTEAEKEDSGYYDFIDNVSDLRDTSQMVNFVENAENLNDLANSTKSALRGLNKDNPSEYSLAILNAAKKRATELNITPEVLIKEVIKKVGNDYKDRDDAEMMMDTYLNKIIHKQQTTPTKGEGPQALTEEQKQQAESDRVKRLTTGALPVGLSKVVRAELRDKRAKHIALEKLLKCI